MKDDKELEQINDGGYLFIKAILELFGNKDETVLKLAECSVEELKVKLMTDPMTVSNTIIQNVNKFNR